MNLRSMLGTLKSLSLTTKVAVAAAVVVGSYIGILRHQNHKLTRELQAETLRAYNAIAAADSTHLLTVAQGDSIKRWTRLAVQEEQRGDSLDRKLKQETRLRAALQLRVDSLVAVVQGTATSEDSNGVRHGAFEAYGAPFNVKAQVDLPPPPLPGTMKLQIQLDPVKLALRAQCGPPDPRGIRRASVLVEGPSWASIELGALTQTPEVCMPQLSPKVQKSHFKLGAAIGAGLVLLSHFLLGAP